MNNISQEQNTERQLQRLAAQRQLYGTAKTVFGWQIAMSVVVPVLLAFIVMICDPLKAYAALWGALASLGDVFWLTPWQKRLRNDAARVQELFDCDVLSLPWNEIKAQSRPDPELIRDEAEKYQRRAASMPPLTNWYAPEVAELPPHVARIACQRSNCWWDAKQRRRYAATIIIAVTAVFVLVLLIAMVNGLTLGDFVLKVAAPLLPAILMSVRQGAEQTETASRVDRLKQHAERLWGDAFSGESKTDSALKARMLQDEILENRKNSPLVFDLIFKHLRGRYEVQMNHGVAELVVEARRKIDVA
jgi:SMODS-associating 4TM effector domain